MFQEYNTMEKVGVPTLLLRAIERKTEEAKTENGWMDGWGRRMMDDELTTLKPFCFRG